MDIRTSQAIDRSRRHHTLQFTHMSVSPILTRLLCGKTFGSGAQFSVALAPSLPNFQVIVPHVPVCVSIALQEEDLRATGWNPMLHQKKCTQVRIKFSCVDLSPRAGTVFPACSWSAVVL